MSASLVGSEMCIRDSSQLPRCPCSVPPVRSSRCRCMRSRTSVVRMTTTPSTACPLRLLVPLAS
eukprot:4795587-Alexandrium_andersonii.AAC.1